MAYKLFDTAQGQFCIDWDVCVQIMKSYFRSESQLAYSQEVRESQYSIVNPLSWGLPDLTFVEVDWDKVKSETQTKLLGKSHLMAITGNFASNGIDQMVAELKKMQTSTEANNDKFRDSMQAASQLNMRRIQQSVDDYESIVKGLKITRDTSASILIGGATVMTGGAALGVAGMGVALKTTAKYQDTGSVGSAAIEATQGIVCTIIPIGRGVKMAVPAKILINVVGDSAKAIIEGKSLYDALANVGVNAGGTGLSDPLKKAIKAILERVASPAVVEALTPIAAKVIEDRLKKMAQEKLKDAGQPETITIAVPAGNQSLFDQVSFKNDMLLKFAIVDMSKGIGRSWW